MYSGCGSGEKYYDHTFDERADINEFSCTDAFSGHDPGRDEYQYYQAGPWQAVILDIEAVNIRDYAFNKHQKVDDYPYGGGAGMLMQAEPVYLAYESVERKYRV